MIEEDEVTERRLMNIPIPGGQHGLFERLFGELRPKLHRYCARMTGSVFDGEDVLQEALAKAIEALPVAGPIANPEGWLFRIAHNAALDFLRRRSREKAYSDEDLDMIVDPEPSVGWRRLAWRVQGARRYVAERWNTSHHPS